MTSLPFGYNWTKFPSAWFGANSTNWESPGQIAEIGRYSLAIFGWQHLMATTGYVEPIFAQLSQAAVIKASHPTLPVFAYACFGCVNGFNSASFAVMRDPAYSDFFLQSTDGPEYTHSACQNMHVPAFWNTTSCIGYFWNFANASARDYFVDNIIGPLAAAPASVIDGVFLDAVNWGYQIPEVRPWGRPVVNIPNCSNPGWAGCNALINGSLDVMRRATALLNSRGKVSMLANPATFANTRNSHIWLDERRLVAALDGLTWMRYYEFVRAETALSSGMLPNMLQEATQGVPAGMHTYYHPTDPPEDPTAHVATFLLARNEGWYYFGSTGWWDDSFVWSPLYDRASQCGRPLGPATSSPLGNGTRFERTFQGCQVSLECESACVGDLKWKASSIEERSVAWR